MKLLVPSLLCFIIEMLCTVAYTHARLRCCGGRGRGLSFGGREIAVVSDNLRYIIRYYDKQLNKRLGIAVAGVARSKHIHDISVRNELE